MILVTRPMRTLMRFWGTVYLLHYGDQGQCRNYLSSVFNSRFIAKITLYQTLIIATLTAVLTECGEAQ